MQGQPVTPKPQNPKDMKFVIVQYHHMILMIIGSPHPAAYLHLGFRGLIPNYFWLPIGPRRGMGSQR